LDLANTVGESMISSRGHQVLKRKGKEKMARPSYQKMSLLSFFSCLTLAPVFSFKNLCYLISHAKFLKQH
jgi:hypothetical protein